MKKKTIILLLGTGLVYCSLFIGYVNFILNDSSYVLNALSRRIGEMSWKRPFNEIVDYNMIKSLSAIKTAKTDRDYNMIIGEVRKTYKCPEVSTNSEYFGDRWKTISVSRDKFVYSAYRDGDKIRIIGITLTVSWSHSPVRICRIWHRNAKKKFGVITTEVETYIIPENHGIKFSAAYFTCPFPGHLNPVAVLLGENTTTSACEQHILPVVNGNLTAPNERNFSVCISPFNRNYSHAYELIEWIELNKILGVQHFTFYTYSLAKNIEHVLSYYSKRGLAEVSSWNIPVSVQNPKEIHYFGQLASLNDCLYRNRYKTKYLAFLDLDEFIVPKHKEDYTWSDMLKRLPVASSYGFRNAFFRRNVLGQNSTFKFSDFARKYKLITLIKFQRDKYIFPMYWRSKLIVDARKVVTMGIHNVWDHKEGKTIVVKKKTGLLHHYRFWNSTHSRGDQVKDEGILKYTNALLENVKDMWNNLAGVEMGPSPHWIS